MTRASDVVLSGSTGDNRGTTRAVLPSDRCRFCWSWRSSGSGSRSKARRTADYGIGEIPARGDA